MDKLTMAHEMALAMIKSNDGYTIGGAVACAWEYADAMQAEADKRQGGVPEAILKASNSRGLEWQPDWSQAPNEANTVTIDYFGVGQYWQMHNGYEPKQSDNSWYDNYHGRYLGGFEPSGFDGDWRNSLRKRPEMEMERHALRGERE